MGKQFRRLLFAAISLVCVPAAIHAATFSYQYSGADLFCTEGSLDCIPGETRAGYGATLVIDEGLLGTSLRNADLIFEYDFVPDDPAVVFAGFLSFGATVPGFWVGNLLGPVCGTDFSLATDSAGEITSGVVSFCDGPPDGVFGGATDSISAGDELWRSAEAGTWTLVSIDGPWCPFPFRCLWQEASQSWGCCRA